MRENDLLDPGQPWYRIRKSSGLTRQVTRVFYQLMKIAVIGASGTIGKAITLLLRKQGHEVVEGSRSTQPPIDIDQPGSIDKFYEETGPIDAVVCAAGNAAFGALDSLTDDQFQLCINSKLMGQINLVRKGLSRLNPGGAFILTGGIFAYKPWPQTSAIAMVNAGLEGFVKAAALDLEAKFRLLIVHPPLVKETATQMKMDDSPWPAAAQVAEVYAAAVTGNETGKPVFLNGYNP